MKRINLIITIAISAIMFTSCEKEDGNLDDNSLTQKTKEKSTLSHNKSQNDYDIDAMAMAANIETIGFVNGSYSITLYNSSIDYTVVTNSFDTETIIDMDIISSTSIVNKVVINVASQTIDMGDIGFYTFDEYKDYVISPSENTVKNLMVVMTIYNSIQPNISKSFANNGDDDNFDPDPNPVGIFWGKGNKREKGVNEVICGPGSVGTVKCWDYYVFWIRIIKDKCGEPDCL